jgi:hypothetical protein
MQNDQEWDSLSLECLPNEILLNIFKYLTAADLSNAVLKVNKRLSDLSRDALRPRLRWISPFVHWTKVTSVYLHNGTETLTIRGEIRDGIHQIVMRNLSGFRYRCPQLSYLVLKQNIPKAGQYPERVVS